MSKIAGVVVLLLVLTVCAHADDPQTTLRQMERDLIEAQVGLAKARNSMIQKMTCADADIERQLKSVSVESVRTFEMLMAESVKEDPDRALTADLNAKSLDYLQELLELGNKCHDPDETS